MTIDSAIRGLRPFAELMIDLHNVAVSNYGAMVDGVRSGQITEERKIEDIMDGLLWATLRLRSIRNWSVSILLCSANSTAMDPT